MCLKFLYCNSTLPGAGAAMLVRPNSVAHTQYTLALGRQADATIILAVTPPPPTAAARSISSPPYYIIHFIATRERDAPFWWVTTIHTHVVIAPFIYIYTCLFNYCTLVCVRAFNMCCGVCVCDGPSVN